MNWNSAARRLSIATVAAAGLLGTTLFAQQAGQPKGTENETSKLVAGMVQRYHLNQPRINDQLSEQFFDEFLADLDPGKMYFTDEDVSEFAKYRTNLDDYILRGMTNFPKYVFARYKQRTEEWSSFVREKLIDGEYDFTAEETMVINGDDRDWGSADEVRERWRKRIKYELLQGRLDEEDVGETKERLEKKYRSIARNVGQFDDTDVMEMFLSAMTQVFDPHSTYMSPDTLNDFQISMRLSLDGIGASLRSDDGYTVVADVLKGGAADADGRLKVGDKIVGVGQTEATIEDIVDMRLSDVVKQIRGERGTKVYLRVRPAADEAKTVVYELTRQKVELEAQEVKGEVLQTEDRIGRPAKIGVISIPSFYRDFEGAQGGGEFKSAVADVRKVLSDFRQQNVDAVIVDIRFNGGGALAEAIEVSGLFIDQGPVVQVREPNGNRRILSDDEPSAEWQGPLVVVTNRASASASEIFAGVIKDYRRGIVVGDKTTHGKGTVQNVMPVAKRSLFNMGPPQGALKLTIQQFYRVNGDSTQNRGVESDIALPSMLDHIDSGEAFLDHALPFDQLPAATYAVTRYISPQIISLLSDLSKERTAEDEDFQKVTQQIERYLKIKDRKEVSLNEAERRAEREANDAAEEAETEAMDELLTDGTGEATEEKDEVFPENAYNDELLQITVDYLDQLRAAQTAQR